LASSRTQTIALVIPEPDSLVLGDPFLSCAITGVSEAFRATDYQVVLLMVRPDEPPAKVARVLRSDYVDGAIVVSQHRSDHVAQIIADNDIPAVYVSRPWTGSGMYVDLDNVRVGEIATRRLIDVGARRIACIAGSPDMIPVQDRTNGWHRALAQAGLTPGPMCNATFTLAGGEQCMRAILATDPQVDGVFAQSDLMAAGAIRVLRDHGIDVPGKVRVIGVDNAEVGRTTVPPLSSVTNPAAELSLRAARMLLRVIDKEEVSPDILQPELVLRESA
jgi:DNA-binding LacI/PurR family transcriptional regulator